MKTAKEKEYPIYVNCWCGRDIKIEAEIDIATVLKNKEIEELKKTKEKGMCFLHDLNGEIYCFQCLKNFEEGILYKINKLWQKRFEWLKEQIYGKDYKKYGILEHDTKLSKIIKEAQKKEFTERTCNQK